MSYTPMTDEEIKDVAIGIKAGTVFTDRHCRSSDEVGLVFIVISMMSDEQRDQILKVLRPDEEGPNGMLYEFMDKALPHSINGLPMFPSVLVCSPEDVDRINEKIKALEAV